MGIPNSNSLNNLRSLLILVAIAYLGKNMENFKLIPLGKSGKFAIVDEEDYEWLSQWEWHLSRGYARSNSPKHKRKEVRAEFMHRLINQTPEGFETDHIDRNKLNNKRSNLRTATRSINSQNRGMFKNNTSGYKGVYFIKKKNKWEARKMIGGKPCFIGSNFDSAEEAAQAYQKFILAPEEEQKQLARNGKQKRNEDTGIYWNKKKERWIAKCHKNGKEYYVGAFINKGEAIAARKNWELSQSNPSP